MLLILLLIEVVVGTKEYLNGSGRTEDDVCRQVGCRQSGSGCRGIENDAARQRDEREVG